MRDGFSRRKDDLAKKLRGADPKRPPLAPVIGGKKKGPRGPVSYRVGSQSAPGDVSSVSSAGKARAAGGGINAVLSIARRAAPATQKAGTSTRRSVSGNPIRRVGGAEVPVPAGVISVTGIGGVRNIREGHGHGQGQNQSYGGMGLGIGVAGIAGRRK